VRITFTTFRAAAAGGAGGRIAGTP
jgi:hypothetical protein